MQRKEIANKVFYTYIKGDFKKNRIAVFLRSPLEKRGLTETALLPYLLERGTKEYPDATLLRRRLNMLYGASLTSSAVSMDFSRVLTAAVEGASDALLPSGGVGKERARLLLDVLLSPNAENGAFPRKYVDIEREKLRELINSEINEKRAYCLKLTSELFFENDERSLPNNGYIDDLDGIDGEGLFAVYSNLLETSEIEIFNVGADEGGMEELFAERFSAIKRAPLEIKKCEAVAYSPVREKTARFDVEQDKLALMYTAGRLLSKREQAVLRVASTLFGGAPTSRLFLNVREKQSLCYYCACRAGLMTGCMTVDSGIEHGDAAKVERAVSEQLISMQEQLVSAKELDEIKLYLKSAMSAVNNSPDALLAWYLSSLLRYGEYVSPESEMQQLMTVTDEEIRSVMSLMKLSARCVITDKAVV